MDRVPDSETLFEEVQEAPAGWMALALGATAIAVVATSAGSSLLARVAMGIAAALATGGALRLAVFPMRTTVTRKAVEVRFGRWIRFRIPVAEIARAYPRRYHPLREYGGWGIRFGTVGRALNMRGDEGVQLELRSGERILIGSQRPNELAAVLEDLTAEAQRTQSPG